MLMQWGIVHIVDVKGAFLYGEFKDGEKYLKVLLGFEQFYGDGTALLLKKMLYGLKQVAMVFYRKLLTAALNIGLMQSSANPCLFYKWMQGKLLL